jgi:hypothetical protein
MLSHGITCDLFCSEECHTNALASIVKKCLTKFGCALRFAPLVER